MLVQNICDLELTQDEFNNLMDTLRIQKREIVQKQKQLDSLLLYVQNRNRRLNLQSEKQQLNRIEDNIDVQLGCLQLSYQYYNFEYEKLKGF